MCSCASATSAVPHMAPRSSCLRQTQDPAAFWMFPYGGSTGTTSTIHLSLQPIIPPPLLKLARVSETPGITLGKSLSLTGHPQLVMCSEATPYPCHLLEGSDAPRLPWCSPGPGCVAIQQPFLPFLQPLHSLSVSTPRAREVFSNADLAT